ncbi:MAG: hypothetical protein RLY30_53 [Pseudomonadota bacterium]|jgi:hypothetical protein
MLSGLFGHAPWRGDDLLGIALARALLDQWLLSPSAEIALWPQLAGLALGRDGPLMPMLMAVFALPFELVSRSLWGHGISAQHFDDLCRTLLAVCVGLGLWGTWRATDQLARRREAQPLDPLGLGPTAAQFGHTLGDCAMLVALACLGAFARWHEAGSAALSFALLAWLLFVVARSPERPQESAWQLGLLLAGLTLSEGPELGLGALLGLILIYRRLYPFHLVGPTMLRGAVIVMVGVVLAYTGLGLWLDASATHAWWQSQLGLDPASPMKALAVWAWTWWPAWPLLLGLGVQSYRLGHLGQGHLLMPLALIGGLLVPQLLGLGESDASRMLPIAPLAVLGAFGLLSIPRSLVSLLDWFAVMIFTSLAVLVWLYWTAFYAEFPAALAERAARFAPGLSGSQPETLSFLLGALASGSWLVLVLWRLRRTQARLWRPVALSAGGSTLLWVLMMTLWLPALDLYRGYGRIAERLSIVVDQNPGCIQTLPTDRVSQALVVAHQIAPLRPAGCQYLLVSHDHLESEASGRATPEIDPASAVWSDTRLPNRLDRERFTLYGLDGSLKN